MKLSEELLKNLQNRLKVGNRRGVHLNAIPGASRYKFDIHKLSNINKDLPHQFVTDLLSESSLKFKISWKNLESDIDSLFLEDQAQLVKIKGALENLINQTSAIEAEKGVNTFGFGYPIIARKDQKDGKLVVAPLIIWSLRIRGSKEYNTWEITRSEDDPIYMNEVFRNHVYGDSGVLLEPLSDEVFEDGILDHDKLANVISLALSKLDSAGFKLSFIETVNMMRNVVPLKDKSGYEKLVAKSTHPVLEMSGIFSIFEVQKQSIIEDYEELINLDIEKVETSDLEGNNFQSLSSVETDPSQQGVLNSLKIKRNTLIQGPPGTGKSQTLTAVLLNALENGKKVLVVCEKRTALEVLYDALKEFKLDTLSILLRDVEKDRRVVVEQVKEILGGLEYQWARSSKTQLNELLKKSEKNIEVINRGHHLLSRELIHPHTWSSIVAKYLKAVGKDDNESEIELGGLQYTFNYEEYVGLKDRLHRGEQLAKDFKAIQDVSYINPEKLFGRSVYEIEETFRRQLRSYQIDLDKLIGLCDTVKEEFMSKSIDRIRNSISDIDKICSVLNELEDRLKQLEGKYRGEYVSNRMDEWKVKFETVKSRITQLYLLEQSSLAGNVFYDERKLCSIGYSLASLFSTKKKEIKSNHFEAQNTFNKLSNILIEDPDLPNVNFRGSLKEKYASLDNLNVLLDSSSEKIQSKYEDVYAKMAIGFSWQSASLKSLIEVDHTCSDNIREIYNKILFDTKRLEELVLYCIQKFVNACELWPDLSIDKATMEIATIDELRSMFKDKMNQLFVKEEQLVKHQDLSFNSALNNLDQFKALGVEKIEELLTSIRDLLGRIDSDKWLTLKVQSDSLDTQVSAIEFYVKSMARHLDDERDILKIVTMFYKHREESSDLEKAITKCLWKSDNWVSDFSKDYYNKILTKHATDEHLNDDKLLQELRNNLSEISNYQIRYIKDFWRNRQSKQVEEFHNLNGGIKVSNLYNFRKSKNFERFSLRKIVKYDKDLFTAFFPVVLTSPEVASTLFKGGVAYFDLVVFDEASQLRLEDNLPSLIKGKQVVIAGDEHQMPPSNYFNRILEGTLVDQDDDVEDDSEKFKLDLNGSLIECESLLQFGENLGFSKRYLDFHYRSKHPYLIDFSNSAFYQKRLKPLPQKFDYTPIQFIQVGGTFSDHTNDAEAEMVLEILEKSIIQKSDGTYPSVGVATFNISQRDLIQEKLNERQKNPKYGSFNKKMDALKQDGFFIKNLENIQGDERDLIILSTTYGRGSDGKFHQRFGPLAQSNGHRLLNVIITRAKYKVFCCTSVPEENILNYKSELVTQGNKGRAVFYAYLAYCKAVSSGDEYSRLNVLSSLEDNYNVKSNITNNEDFHFDSEFEEEVYDRLVDEVGKENLIPQMKVGGFRIDIVYKSPIAGVPMIAIECDGAKYHSSNEAYLYDIHRQKILEKQGFVFHRIWSTNWWRSPKMEMKRLLKFISEIEVKSNSFEDQIESIENVYSQFVEYSTTQIIEKLDTAPTKEVKETVKVIKEAPIQGSLFDGDIVGSSSKVKVLYRNTDDLIEIKLVNSEKEESAKGKLRMIYYKKPLAQAIIGKRVGDVVKIGKLDTYVEILEISN